MIEDFVDDKHTRRYIQYQTEKVSLIGETIRVAPRSKHSKEPALYWKVRQDIKPDASNTILEFNQIGVVSFPFDNRTERSGLRNALHRINFLDLLIHLWPGDWKEQLKKMNIRIRLSNNVLKINGRGNKRVKYINEISEHEFWVWWGLVIVARQFGRLGTIWDRHEPEGIEPTCNFTGYMNETRHREIRKEIASIFSEPSRQGADAWWNVSAGIDAFNEKIERIV